jgi:hypothetical protein
MELYLHTHNYVQGHMFMSKCKRQNIVTQFHISVDDATRVPGSHRAVALQRFFCFFFTTAIHEFVETLSWHLPVGTEENL